MEEGKTVRFKPQKPSTACPSNAQHTEKQQQLPGIQNNQNSSPNGNFDQLFKSTEMLPKAKLINNRMQKEMIATKSVLKQMYKAEDNLQTLGSPDKVLSLFLSLKSVDSLQIKSPKEANSKSDVRNEAEESLIHFEEKFKTFPSSSDLQKQCEMMFELIETKDDAQYRISKYLLDGLAVELIANDNIPEECSKDLAQLLTLFFTFRTLGNAIKKIELTREHAEKAHQLMALQQKNEFLQKELSEKSSELKELKVLHQNFLSETGRQQVLFRQQSVIESLELDVRGLNMEIDSLMFDRRKIIQNESVVSDALALAQSQLSNMIQAYERDIVSMRPVVEKQINQLQVDLRDMQSLQQSVELNARRVTVVESQHSTAKQEIDELKARIQQLQKELLREQRRNERLDADNKKKERIAQVVVAAKLQDKEECDKLRKEKNIMTQLLQECRVKIETLEDQIDDAKKLETSLRGLIKQQQDAMTESSSHLKIQRADISSQEMMIHKLNSRILELESNQRMMYIQSSSQSHPDFKNMQLRKTAAENSLLEGQLRLSHQKVNDLMKELALAKGEPLPPPIKTIESELNDLDRNLVPLDF